MNNYTPTPVETKDIVLADDLLLLTEKLAENAHDHWAILRMKEGWTWGEQRDDKEKTHPDLIPYKELSDAEKQYDRNTAMETLKAIMAMGYKIEN